MKDTIDMAREVESEVGFMWCVNFIELARFEALVRADEREQGQKWFDAVTAQHKQLILAEREACAKVCDDLPPPERMSLDNEALYKLATLDCAEAIRARGNT
jgi:hypothetical protein